MTAVVLRTKLREHLWVVGVDVGDHDRAVADPDAPDLDDIATRIEFVTDLRELAPLPAVLAGTHGHDGSLSDGHCRHLHTLGHDTQPIV